MTIKYCAMKNWFLSIEGIFLLWAFSGCQPNASEKNIQDPVQPHIEEVMPSDMTDTLPLGQQQIPEEGLEVAPGSVDVKSNPNPAPREKPIVNPYNTKGPNQSKVDSIKAEKTKKKK